MRRDQKKHVPFLSELFGLTLVLAVLIRVLISWDFFATYQPFVWASMVFLALTTIGVYFIMLRAMAMQTHTNFVIAFGTGFAIKSFASLAFICYFIFFRPIADHRFVFPFFIMYFAYTALLIWDIWQSSKRKPLP